MKNIYVCWIFILCTSCSGTDQPTSLKDILAQSDSPALLSVLDDPEKYEYQIMYTQIDRDENQQPHFTTYSLNVDDERYFYPASTVKMPTAILALEKLNELNVQGLSRNTKLKIDSSRYPQTPVVFDPTAKDSIPTIGHYVKHIFVVSDNDANNRLYEFVGQDEIHERLRKKGYKTRIIHRLGNSLFGPEENKYTNPITFYQGNQTIYQQAERVAKLEHIDQLKNSTKGNGYVDQNDSLIYQPFDFRKKNHFPLSEQLKVVQSMMFPESIAPSERFNLSDEQYEFVRTQMSKLPRESKYPDYADSTHYDSYVKFFISGDKKTTIPDHIRVFNKVGWAYGYLTDCSYIVDFKHGVEYLIAATIHVNENGIYNDGNYEYETEGLPFFAELGQVIYKHELARSRNYAPDLSKFKLNYQE